MTLKTAVLASLRCQTSLCFRSPSFPLQCF